jgi:DNA-binding response OmpR family regulator
MCDMTPLELPAAYRVLLVDDDDGVRSMMTQTLEYRGFRVVAASNVAEALRFLTTEPFDALITDLHMPAAGDGFTVVSAMRHAQPKALTMIVSGYPDVKNALDTILLEADEILVKPLEMGKLPGLMREKLAARRSFDRAEKQRVGTILARSSAAIVEDWLTRAKQAKELNHLAINDEERTGHLAKMVERLVARLNLPSGEREREGEAGDFASAEAHGKLRYQQGYTAAMLVNESRILQVTLFGTLQKNFDSIDFSLLLPDVMTIADEVDAQLTQIMSAYMNAMRVAAAAA